MSVKIRLRRIGAKQQPIYRVVIAEGSFPLQGRVIEEIGLYNPRSKPPLLEIDQAKIDAWLKKGAQPTPTVARLLKKIASASSEAK